MSFLSRSTTRRSVLRGIAATGALLPFGVGAATHDHREHAQAAGKPLFPAQPEPLKLGWLNAASCVAPVPLAQQLGYFKKYNLDVELRPYAFHTPEFLAAPQTGELDAAVTMVHNWLFAINDGVDARIITPVHGGCVRILGSRAAGVSTIESLRGKTLPSGIGEMAKLSRAVFSVVLLNNGLDPERDVKWLAVDEKTQEQALRDGRIHALLGLDPPLYVLQKNNPDLVEIATNHTGPMAGRVCCVAAAGRQLWQDRPLAASALVLALNEAAEYAQQHPDEAAKIFAANSKFALADIEGAQRGLDYHSHQHLLRPLRDDIELYIRDFQKVGALPPGLIPEEFIKRSYVDIKTHA